MYSLNLEVKGLRSAFPIQVLSAHFNMSGAQVSIAYGAPQGMFVVDSSAVKVGVTPLDRETADKRSLVLEVKTGGESEGYAKVTDKCPCI